MSNVKTHKKLSIITVLQLLSVLMDELPVDEVRFTMPSRHLIGQLVPSTGPYRLASVLSKTVETTNCFAGFALAPPQRVNYATGDKPRQIRRIRTSKASGPCFQIPNLEVRQPLTCYTPTACLLVSKSSSSSSSASSNFTGLWQTLLDNPLFHPFRGNSCAALVALLEPSVVVAASARSRTASSCLHRPGSLDRRPHAKPAPTRSATYVQRRTATPLSLPTPAPTNMPESQTDTSVLPEPSFTPAPNQRVDNSLPRLKSNLSEHASENPKVVSPRADDEASTQLSNQDRSPLLSPSASNAADAGLPPTPPSNSRDDDDPPTAFSPPPHADNVVALMSQKSSLTTPLNQRSPPTPDASPERTSESVAAPMRPSILAYPSSRAESFKTAKEDQYSTDLSNSRSTTPLADRLSTVAEERSLGLAFERAESNSTPANGSHEQVSTQAPIDIPESPRTPVREWDPHLMRNVTIRKKRNPRPSPEKLLPRSVGDATTSRGSPRSISLGSKLPARAEDSPHIPSLEQFAQSIGWPTEVTDKRPADETPTKSNAKRLSASSMGSTVVEATVIVTPPKTPRTLRHSGKNLAYRRDADNATLNSSRSNSNRGSLDPDDIPLNRLVHHRVSITHQKKLSGTHSPITGEGSVISSLSNRSRIQDSSAYTRAHQEAVKHVLQPAALIMSRSNSLSRGIAGERNHHKRISSAPEPIVREVELRKTADQMTSDSSPAQSFKKAPRVRQLLPPVTINKPLPEIPSASPENVVNELKAGPTADRIDEDKLDAQASGVESAPTGTVPFPGASELPNSPSQDKQEQSASPPIVRRGSLPTRGRSDERRKSSISHDRTSTSHDTNPRPSLDRIPVEELPRRSHEWCALSPNDIRRLSFDRSTSRSEEHALARHLFAQTTPFSQFSDTPIEVSEATAVSIYPHHNHSLLVVQQLARPNTLPLEHQEVPNDQHTPSSDPAAPALASKALCADIPSEERPVLQQPTVNIEPSTPPRQITLPVPGTVDSPLRNPRAAPEPPVIKFIPPTPAEELDKQLVANPPGPPTRSNSHPQRRLSLVQRARRYSDNLITPILARASSVRGRHVSESHAARQKSRVPTVNEGDGSLHPFWRPRGFWDGFEESDSDDDVLPQGGDTSDVEPVVEPEPSGRKLGALGRRLTNGFKGTGGFLIGNSLGVERAGTNRRRPQITLPSHQRNAAARPKPPLILIQRPTLPINTRSRRVEKRGSQLSLRKSRSHESLRRRRSRREAWRAGRKIPGMKGLHVQYIGLSGVKDMLRERRAEKRRQLIRKSIGSRYYVEGAMR
ncbi:uncharacterized protein EI97DRAFT_499465 [Westerdykella ornata]|uniref:Uncharacterized protein n=1 Tax=Westerdykella ornata TaxID=318751 RepID=A0A6A6JS55_WESOR|nr:uncharacterized protein EI97DRAFT_499465 [Westerdykella ornata]KAF2278943.1 hypothetical protein EI97DRAFT_499465 [Westerdykella ornata]